MINAKIGLPIYDPEKCRLFALGRNAMYAGCVAMGLKDGDEVLTPAFDCDSALQPFRALALKEVFYRSDPYTFSASIEDIGRRITPKTKLIHIINHFGMPQPWDGLLKLRKDRGIPIMEDNAYSLFSGSGGKDFGSFGDVAVFSLRKNLPIVNGGMLRINNPAYSFNVELKKGRWFYPAEYRRAAKLVAQRAGLDGFIKNAVSIVCRPEGSPPPLYSDPDNGYPDLPARDQTGMEFSCDYLRPISGWARAKLAAFTRSYFSNLADKKRYYYGQLSKRLIGLKGIRVLWPEIDKETVPHYFSFLVDSHRDAFLKILRKKYDVLAWPTLSQSVLDRLGDFPDVALLGRKLLQLDLPADKITRRNFMPYLDNFVRDITGLSDKYF